MATPTIGAAIIVLIFFYHIGQMFRSFNVSSVFLMSQITLIIIMTHKPIKSLAENQKKRRIGYILSIFN